ncbi:MAG: hypothetical protein JKX69_01035 [Rhodobacteraceae bacterium]|nr:hypothetical protein [Paracoccaceae bacterium]
MSQVALNGYCAGTSYVVLDDGSGNDTVTGWSPVEDYVFVGAYDPTDPADIVVVKTATQTWEIAIVATGETVVLDFTFYFSDGFTEADIRARLVGDATYTPPVNSTAPACFIAGCKALCADGWHVIETLQAGGCVQTLDHGP